MFRTGLQQAKLRFLFAIKSLSGMKKLGCESFVVGSCCLIPSHVSHLDMCWTPCHRIDCTDMALQEPSNVHLLHRSRISSARRQTESSGSSRVSIRVRARQMASSSASGQFSQVFSQLWSLHHPLSHVSCGACSWVGQFFRLQLAIEGGDGIHATASGPHP